MKVKAKEIGRVVWIPISQPTPKAKVKATSLSLSLSLGMGRPLDRYKIYNLMIILENVLTHSSTWLKSIQLNFDSKKPESELTGCFAKKKTPKICPSSTSSSLGGMYSETIWIHVLQLCVCTLVCLSLGLIFIRFLSLDQEMVLILQWENWTFRCKKLHFWPTGLKVKSSFYLFSFWTTNKYNVRENTNWRK